MQYLAFAKEMMNRFESAGQTQAFEEYDGENLRCISYEQFYNDILSYAGYFAVNGLSDKHIAILSQNCYEWAVTLFAIFASGNIAVPLNPALSDEEISAICAASDTDLIICHPTYTAEGKTSVGDFKMTDFNAFTGSVPIAACDIHQFAFDDTILLLATSGTTGKSKIVELSSGNISSSTDSCSEHNCAKGNKHMWLFPFFHAAGLYSLFMSSSLKTFCIGRGNKYIFADINVFNPTHLGAVPAVTETLLKVMKNAGSYADIQNYIGKNLQSIMCTGAKLNRASFETMARLGIFIYTGYGMSETSMEGSLCTDKDHPDALGIFNPAITCRIEDGEILLKGPAIMKGYYKDPEETAKVIIDGWLHTGDMGYQAEDGYYYLTGRKKNVICLANGENVNPEEIEEKLSLCPSINEILVYSDGKGIVADVYSSDDTAADEYIAEYNNSVPVYRQVYKTFHYPEPLEKTGSGKIKRKANL